MGTAIAWNAETGGERQTHVNHLGYVMIMCILLSFLFTFFNKFFSLFFVRSLFFLFCLLSCACGGA